MERKWVAVLKIGAIYAGAVLGAGFASGQELSQFFVRFGFKGLWGAAAAGLLFCACGAAVLWRSFDLSERSAKAYFARLFGRRLSGLIHIVVTAFLAVSFIVMISGSGALVRERFGIAPVWGSLATLVICYFVFCGNLDGLSAVNFILTPLMIIGMSVVCVYFLMTQERPAWLAFPSGGGMGFLWSAALYVSYNMLTATAVLVPVGAIAKNRKAAATGGLLGGGALLLVILLSCAALVFAESGLLGAELPLLLLSKRLGHLAYTAYSAVLYMAMLTTAVATGFSIVEWFVRKRISRGSASFLVCLASFPLSFFPFSALVKNCYTLFGYLGLLLLCGIVWDIISKK